MRIRDERSVGQKNNRRKSVEKDVVLAVVETSSEPDLDYTKTCPNEVCYCG